MKTHEFNAYLSRKGMHVITVAETARIIGKSKAYASLFLHRNKELMLAKRGLYYTKDAGDYEVASRLVRPGYVSLVSSLRFYNLTEQIPHIIYVVSAKRHKRVVDGPGGYEVEFRKIREELMYGYRKVDDAFVADPEKAVIDMLYLGEFEEYAEEVVEKGLVDFKKLVRYAELSGVATLIKKVKAMKYNSYNEREMVSEFE
jgi:predicted transcriptional regulator of viral defense system